MRKYIFLLIVILFSNVFAEESGFELPNEIHEFENAMIIVRTNTPFTFSTNIECMKVNRTKSLEHKRDMYKLTAESGYIELDNKCFAGDKVTLEIKTQGKVIKKTYNLLPPIKEERNWGC
ncbi:hypothetical protein DSN97_01800 [Deferribacteraceae bacterium V6Fe1]|nr:hypothetical protein DSN97_01800 [Deferribacteraceae bacterium V6Fe1]